MPKDSELKPRKVETKQPISTDYTKDKPTNEESIEKEVLGWIEKKPKDSKIKKYRLKRTVTIHFANEHPYKTPLGYRKLDNWTIQNILQRALPELAIVVHYNETPDARDKYYEKKIAEAMDKPTNDICPQCGEPLKGNEHFPIADSTCRIEKPDSDLLKHHYDKLKQTEKIMLERFESLQHSKITVLAERDKMESVITQLKKQLSESYKLWRDGYGKLQYTLIGNVEPSKPIETLFDFLIKLKRYLKSEKIHSSEHRGSDGVIYIRDGGKRYAITIKEEKAY